MFTIASAVSCLVGLNVLIAIICDVFFIEPGKTLHSLDFRLRRARNWLPLGIVYCGFYTARYNMAAANVPSVSKESRMLSGSIPLALSLGFWFYAITAPWTGMNTDRIGGRRAMLLATYASLVCNLVAAVLSWIPKWASVSRTVLILFFYTSNVVFQGFGTSAVVKINAMWYGPQERGSFSGVFNVLVTCGYYTSLGAGSLIAKTFGFSSLLLLPSIFLGIGGFFVYFWVQDQPETCWSEAVLTASSEGKVEEIESLVERENDIETRNYNSVKQSVEKQDNHRKINVNSYEPSSAFIKLSSDTVFLCYCGAVFFLSLVRDGLISWIFYFLESRRGSDLSADATTMLGAGITMGGFLGGVSCGVMSDRVFRGSRVQPILVFTIGQVLALAILWSYGGQSSDLLDAMSLFLASFFVCGNYSLLNYTIPSDLNVEVIGTAVGLLTMTGYIASGLGGFTMHLLIKWGGFEAWITLLVISSVFAACTIILGSMATAFYAKNDASSQAELTNSSLRMSTSSDVDMVAGLIRRPSLT